MKTKCVIKMKVLLIILNLILSLVCRKIMVFDGANINILYCVVYIPEIKIHLNYVEIEILSVNSFFRPSSVILSFVKTHFIFLAPGLTG